MKHKTIIAAHGVLGTTVMQKLRDENIEVVAEEKSPFTETFPTYELTNIYNQKGEMGRTSGDRLRDVVLKHIRGKRSVRQEADLIHQKLSRLPSAARKYVMEVMVYETDNSHFNF
jgi:hypothetical protein